jgi:hypothetical protein
VRTTGRKLTHRRQDRALHPSIRLYLSQTLQGSLDRGDSSAPCVDHQLVANRPTPEEFIALNRPKE